MIPERDGTKSGTEYIRQLAGQVFSGEKVGIIVVITHDGEGSLAAHIHKGKAMGDRVFPHAILTAIRALTGLWEMGVKGPHLEVRDMGDGHGR